MHPLKSVLALITLIAATTAPTWASQPGAEDVDARIDTLLLANDIPGAIVLIEVNGERRVHARGLADRDSGLEMSGDQLMRMASVGKLYTAAIIHQLVLSGQINLDRALADYVDPDWIAGIANADEASVRQLLNHTSGIPDYYDDDWFAAGDPAQPLTPDLTFDYIRGRPADFPTGSDHAYSNTNYQYLGLIAEAVSGQSLAQLYASLLIEPLGLTATGYNIQFDPRDRIHGYGSVLDPEQDAYSLFENSGADGGVFARAEDAADFLQAVFHDTGRLAPLGASMLSDLYDRGNGRYRALGPAYVEHELGFTAVTHGGSIAGYATIAIQVISHDVTLIVHLNRDRPDLAVGLARDLLIATLSAPAG